MTQRSSWPVRGPIWIGTIAIAILIAALGGWGLMARIAGAVVTDGIVKVESNRQVIQHPDGGVVSDILVYDGDRVTAGDVLLRLDTAQLRSQLAIIEGQLLEISARKARLVAERDGADQIDTGTTAVSTTGGSPSYADLIAGQIRLFDARRAARTQERDQLLEQRAQIENQILGTQAQLTALRSQRDLIVAELEDAQSLLARGLAQASRVSALQRQEAQIMGEIGKLTATVAQLRGQTAGLNIDMVRLDTRRREDAISTLRDLTYTSNELDERAIALRDTIDRMEIRSPVSGVIYGSTVFALQSVVSPAEPVMYVIPEDQPLIIAAQIETIDIDQVYEDQAVSLRFPTFDQRTTPEIAGSVSQISADAFMDEARQAPYFRVKITPDANDLAGLTLKPGMPVQVFIKTKNRAPLSYLTQPFMDYFARAFRER